MKKIITCGLSRLKLKIKNTGFTLIELLVVVAVIGLLASILLVAVNRVRGLAKISKAKADLAQISTAIARMGIDTNLWTNGCRLDYILAPVEGSSNEVSLNSPEGGLVSKPPVGVTDASAGCDWTNAAVNAWNGPYVQTNLVDPWGSPYWFDNDYHPLRDCPTPNANVSTTTAAIVSLGPDRIPENNPDNYNCDDIYLNLAGSK